MLNVRMGVRNPYSTDLLPQVSMSLRNQRQGNDEKMGLEMKTGRGR